jgi:hypothetical protein
MKDKLSRTNVKPFHIWLSDGYAAAAKHGALSCLGHQRGDGGRLGQQVQVYNELKKMGAQVQVDGKTALSRESGIHGSTVNACDLRAGAAIVIAGLCANGITTWRCPFYRARV